MSFSFGMIPDLLQGKILKETLANAATNAAIIGTGGLMGGGSAAGGTAASAAPITEGVFAGATPAGLISANAGGGTGAAGGLSSMAGAGGGASGSGLLGSSLQAMQAAGMAKGLLSEPQQQVQGGQLPQANNGINDALQQRQQQYAQYMQNRRM